MVSWGRKTVKNGLEDNFDGANFHCLKMKSFDPCVDARHRAVQMNGKDSLMAIKVESYWCPLHQSILLTQVPICKILATIAQLLGLIEKLSLFESAILNFIFQNFFFCFIPMKISQNLLSKDVSKFWWFPWFPAPNSTPA